MNLSLFPKEDSGTHDSRPIIVETPLPANISPEHLKRGITRGAEDIQCRLAAQSLLSLSEVSDFANGDKVVFLANGPFEPELQAGKKFGQGALLSLGVVALGDSSLAVYIDKMGRTVFYPVANACVKPTVPAISEANFINDMYSGHQMHPDYWWDSSTFPRGIFTLRCEGYTIPEEYREKRLYEYVTRQVNADVDVRFLKVFGEFSYDFITTKELSGRYFVVADISDEFACEMYDYAVCCRPDFEELYQQERGRAVTSEEAGRDMNLYLRLLARQAAHELDPSNPGVYVMRMQKGELEVRDFGARNRRW